MDKKGFQRSRAEVVSNGIVVGRVANKISQVFLNQFNKNNFTLLGRLIALAFPSLCEETMKKLLMVAAKEIRADTAEVTVLRGEQPLSVHKGQKGTENRERSI